VREGHGDLHLANLVEIDGEVLPFDAIEFDAALRFIDIVDDVAFTAMDLKAHGRADLAARFVDAWVEAGGDHAAAFAAYERRLMPFLAGKQESARKFASTFAPKSRTALLLRDLAMWLMRFPKLAEFFVGDLEDGEGRGVGRIPVNVAGDRQPGAIGRPDGM